MIAVLIAVSKAGRAMTYGWLRSQTHAALENEVNESTQVQGWRTGWEHLTIQPFSN